jgi:hypothetical protein
MVVVDRRFMVIMEAARTSEMSVYFNETTQRETTQHYPPPIKNCRLQLYGH